MDVTSESIENSGIGAHAVVDIVAVVLEWHGGVSIRPVRGNKGFIGYGQCFGCEGIEGSRGGGLAKTDQAVGADEEVWERLAQEDKRCRRGELIFAVVTLWQCLIGLIFAEWVEVAEQHALIGRAFASVVCQIAPLVCTAIIVHRALGVRVCGTADLASDLIDPLAIKIDIG